MPATEYRGYSIHETGFYAHPRWREVAWTFAHADYDGAEDGCDRRCGTAESVEACKREIDELEQPAD